MKKQLIFILSTITLLLVGCTSSTVYKNGEKFTFDDKEIKSKLVYFCQNKPNLAPMSIRAEKAHAYFTQKNNINVQILIDSVGDEEKKETVMLDFQKRAEKLALKLHKKFSCTLVDSKDY